MLPKNKDDEFQYRKTLSEKAMGNKNGLGAKRSIEWIENLSKRVRGRKLTQESKDKISKNRKGKCLGENNGSWNGGASYLPYSIDWKNTLKISIRERDKYTCQICKEKQGDIIFHIHHIDYDKLNCNPDNLITLCVSCHSKTNFNREYWIEYFKYYGNYFNSHSQTASS